MKKFVFSMSLFGLFLAAAWTVDARDTKHILPIALDFLARETRLPRATRKRVSRSNIVARQN